MIRILLINLLLFVAPFVLVWLWTKFLATNKPDAQKRRHYAIAAIIGLLLVMASLLSYRFGTGNAPDGTYVPPSFKDGQVVPGRFE